MAISTKAVNAGVNAANGFEFQKHCALLILFDQYSQLKSHPYFICLEHHDDFLLSRIAPNGHILSIQAYQAKKSTTDWGMSQDLYDLLSKIAQGGLDLAADPIKKDPQYDHSLQFLSNRAINLNNKKTKKNKITATINASNTSVGFSTLDQTISDVIKNELKNTFSCSPAAINELQKMTFRFIDLPQTSSKQKSTLIGEFGNIFGNSVIDHKAAVDTLLLLFRNVENTLNNGNIIKLMDVSKQVTSDEINKAINIITTQTKAYELWRTKGDAISDSLNIPIISKKKFVQDFTNSFDLFKDLQQADHRLVYTYVQNNKMLLDTLTTDAECIVVLYKNFKANIRTQLGENELKAAIYAAYIELLESL
ncbi:dsDNA nuclease domain-containing protein [Mucilaginibacter endophyticus]|uniref:dsDNA nuclease domain-containing protein n=1 Tax=Mucilaginibacter endophyticus TaxID=2675003 RepID=UPI000E0D1186|nr:dsDNA nuclease domain-containing protein [Mucilaginibacter endophyticus]